MPIHETAIVSAQSHIAPSATIGPYSIVEDGVEIGEETVLESHVVIRKYTHLGCNNRVGTGTVLGAEPQDKKFQGEKSFLHIGHNNLFREYVTVHRAAGEGKKTIIGDNNFFMVQCHIGHNCIVGNGVVITNLVALSGYCKIDDYAVIGGLVGLHQFVRVGSFSYIGGHSAVAQDVPPFCICRGNPCRLTGVNIVGLRRHQFQEKDISGISAAFHKLFFSGKTLKSASSQLEKETSSEKIKLLLHFLQETDRGIIRAHRVTHSP